MLSCFSYTEVVCAYIENLWHIPLLCIHFFCATMPKSDYLETENYADSHLSFTVLYSDNLRHSGMDLWVFPPFALFLKGLGDGGEYQRIQSWIDFCFALSFTSWLCQMQCVSHAVSLFREPRLGQLVSIQRQGKEDKILLSACWDCK